MIPCIPMIRLRSPSEEPIAENFTIINNDILVNKNVYESEFFEIQILIEKGLGQINLLTTHIKMCVVAAL